MKTMFEIIYLAHVAGLEKSTLKKPSQKGSV